MAEIKKLQFSSGIAVTAPTDLSAAASGGSGEVNAISTPNDASATWTASAAGITVATTTTSSDLPLSGIVSSAIKITPVSGTDYVRYRFTMPAALKQRKLKIQWEQRALSGYASGDLKVDMYVNSASDYSGSHTRQVLSTDASAVSSISSATGRFVTYFDTASSDYYELRITRVAGTTALNITSVIVGPGVQPQGAIVSAAQAWGTPTTGNLGTVTNDSLFYSRVGSTMIITGSLKVGTPAAGLAFVTLPAGLTINSGSYTTGRNVLGYAQQNAAAAAVLSGNLVACIYNSSDNTSIYFAAQTDTAASNSTVSSENGNAVFNSNATVTFVNLRVEVSQWQNAGNINLAQNDIEYAYTSGTWDAADTTTAFGTGGATIAGALTANRSKTVTWQSPIADGDVVTVWFRTTSSEKFVPINGVFPYALENATTYGAQWLNISSTQTRVDFARYSSGGATFGAAGTAWVSGQQWLVTKTKAGVAVGFGLANSVASGLAPAGTFGGESGVVDLQEVSSTPAALTASNEAKVYLKADKLIIAFNDAGTTRYKYLDLTGTGVTWVHTTSAP